MHADGVSTIREAFNIIQVIVPRNTFRLAAFVRGVRSLRQSATANVSYLASIFVVSGNKAFKTVDVSLSTHKASHITLGGQVGEELLRLPC